MKVFISHSSKDSNQAKMIEAKLRRNGISSYLDLYDDRLVHNRGTAEITPKIVEELEQCNILLAIVTEVTKNSWWVPFEIGIARANLLSISSYTTLSIDNLPEFLLEWPRLYTTDDLSEYISFIRSESNTLNEAKAGLEDYSSMSFSNRKIKFDDSFNKLRNFESSIMEKLNQTRRK